MAVNRIEEKWLVSSGPAKTLIVVKNLKGVLALRLRAEGEAGLVYIE
jgi:hypothetical protein